MTRWLRGGYPLQTLNLSNFKGVREAEIAFRPLTVIAGANSSGKSTLIQSLALLHQVAAASRRGRRFPLNGGEVALGSFEDVLFRPASGDRPDEIRLGMTFRPGDQTLRRVSYGITLGRSADSDAGAADIRSLEVSESRPSPRVKPGGGRTQRESGLALQLAGGISDATLRKRREAAGLHRALVAVDRIQRRAGAAFVDDDAFSYEGTYSDNAGTPPRPRSRKVRGAQLEGAVPSVLLTEEHTTESLVLWWLYHHVFAAFRYDRADEFGMSSKDFAKARREITAAAVQDLRKYFEVSRKSLKTGEPLELESFLRKGEGSLEMGGGGSPAVRAVLREAYLSMARGSRKAKDLNFNMTIRIREQLDALKALQPKTLLSAESAEYTYLRTFLDEGIRYVGPLRSEPDLVYRQLPVGPVGSVGRRGEFAAAVLRMRGSSEISQPPLVPGSIKAPSTLSGLLDAWMSYLQLADRVTAEERGPLGFSLALEHGGRRSIESPLGVGVGFSQALPVVMQCLLAGPGTVVLLEQPELHLHPSAQQRLADFFLACARSGRQLVVETHSDHIVNRLRLLVAEDASDEAVRLVGLLFAEQEYGATTYRPVELSEYGALIDWPRGFFTDGVQDAEALIKAALEKQRRKAGEETSLAGGFAPPDRRLKSAKTPGRKKSAR